MSDLALFEKGFIERTYPSIVSDDSVAFAELVANAWDAGATKVDITIPSEQGEDIIIQDNGSGMSDDDFRNRWMVIAYNRVEHQGEYIEYKNGDGVVCKRLAYGRNGVGRHALVCFDDSYVIETSKDRVLNKYRIAVAGGESAFSIKFHEQSESDKVGTKIIVKASKRLPDAQAIMKTLGYKFIFDPMFEVFINGIKVEYHNKLSPDKEDIVSTKYGNLYISIYKIPDGEKATSNSGVAMWVNGRLVGRPSWIIGKVKIEDARRKFAIKHIIIVKADYLINDVLYDWSDFRDSEYVKETNQKLVSYIHKYRIEYYKGRTTETRNEVIKANRSEIRNLSIPAVYNLKQFFDNYLEKKPEVEADDLNIIVSSLVNVLNNDQGLSLLAKLSVMSDASISDLDKILDQWSVSDIKTILEEIDSRLAVIDAIQKLCSDSKTDELHVLHPLVTQARWLFGIEYDNPNYTFNKRLSTVLKSLLDGKIDKETSIKWNKRPDLVIGADFSISATCVEEFNQDEIACIDRVLIIELKKGGFKIGRNEIAQAEEYVESLYHGNKLNAKPKIRAYVVGDSIESGISTHKKQDDFGEVKAYTYHQLISTAEKKFFNLKAKIEEHYNQFNSDDYVKAILSEPEQLKLNNID